MKALTLQIASLLIAGLLLTAGCKKDQQIQMPTSTEQNAGSFARNKAGLSGNRTATTAELIAYKNSAHQLSMGYYSVSGTGWLDIPDSVDIVDNWGSGPFNDTANNYPYIRQIQNEKGTRVIHCAWPPNVGTLQLLTGTKAYYDQWAQTLYNQVIVQAGMDGVDLDMESGLLNNMTLLDQISFMNSIITYFGKTSQYTIARTGKKPLLVFGTDGSIGNVLMTLYASNIDYVMFQAYADPGDYWQGNLTTLTLTLKTHNAGSDSKFIVCANGQSGYAWNVNSSIGGTNAQIIEYANWCKQNGAGGVGAFHQETDFNHVPPYIFTKQTIAILNP